jgi:hypothetical protein
VSVIRRYVRSTENGCELLVQPFGGPLESVLARALIVIDMLWHFPILRDQSIPVQRLRRIRFRSTFSSPPQSTPFHPGQATWLTEPMLTPNLYNPVPGDQGAPGAFDDISFRVTPQTLALRHRGVVGIGGVLALIAVASAVAVFAKRR